MNPTKRVLWDGINILTILKEEQEEEKIFI